MKSNFYGNKKPLVAVMFCTALLSGSPVAYAANVGGGTAYAADKTTATNKDGFIWYNGEQVITYSVSESVSPVVTVALDMFKGDMQQVTGVMPQKKSSDTAIIDIVQLDKDKSAAKELCRQGVPVDSLIIKKDAFFIKVFDKKRLLVVGSDGRGTAYGILELSRLAGVSPWVWWGDVTPIKKRTTTTSCRLHHFSKSVRRISRHLSER